MLNAGGPAESWNDVQLLGAIALRDETNCSRLSIGGVGGKVEGYVLAWASVQECPPRLRS